MPRPSSSKARGATASRMASKTITISGNRSSAERSDMASPSSLVTLLFSRSLSIAENTAKRAKMLASSRSEEHTSELQSLMRISYAVFCLQKKKQPQQHHHNDNIRNTINHTPRSHTQPDKN